MKIIKTLRDLNIRNKKVIIRVDFNVPIKEGKIIDDNRIKMSLKTINYAIENNAKVILMSHLGRIKTEEDKINNSLKIVSDRLSELLGKSITFINSTRGTELENAINCMNNGDVILMENTRFEDANGKLESSNDPELGKYWASLGDIFINDAFGTSHRAHASNVGIASHLPCGIGFLVQKELDNMLPVINNPTHPFTVILGGSKVSDKIGVIKNLIPKCDYLLIGGGMEYTFLKAKGIEVGKSIVEDDYLDYAKELLSTTDKIILPVDNVVSDSLESETSHITKEISVNEMGLDIGPETIELFRKYIMDSKTIVWNGPVGVFENKMYQNGTKSICAMFTKDQTVIIGGGDSASAVINLGYKDNVTHISTGGGASLELLEGKDLPGISIIGE
jgi:phosphoglycerate kinase